MCLVKRKSSRVLNFAIRFFLINYSNYFSKLSADVMEDNVINYKLCTYQCQAGGGGGWGRQGLGQGFD